MDKLFIAFEKLFIEGAKMAGLNDEQTAKGKIILLTLVMFSIAFGLVWQAIKYAITVRNKRVLNEDLAPHFSYNDVLRARKYYIPTKHQSVAPSIDDELGGKYITSPKEELIPVFIKKVFTRNHVGNKFYLILADSGMGKTTFMINLYVKYKNKLKWPFSKPGFDIKLFPLGAKDVLEKIKSVGNKSETILLLDAFDEDVLAIADYHNRMKQLLDVVSEFRVIVISCRTQFFPNQKEEPYETGYMTFGGDGENKFEKSYVSVFDDMDIKKYLNKRYSLINRKSRLRAEKIIKQCPNLMVRPMLLSHIEDLVNNSKEWFYTYELYDTLIQQWLIRESHKPGIKEKYKSVSAYQDLLLRFSQKLARNLYENAEQRKGYFIPKNVTFELEGLSIRSLNEHTLSISEAEGRFRSLLNRDAEGNYKFAHKSILEYFLAKELMRDKSFLANFDYTGMDMAYKFFAEMASLHLTDNGGGYMGAIKFTYHSEKGDSKREVTHNLFQLWDSKFDVLIFAGLYNSLVILCMENLIVLFHLLNYMILKEVGFGDTVELLEAEGLYNIAEFLRKMEGFPIYLFNGSELPMAPLELLKSGNQVYFRLPSDFASLRNLNKTYCTSPSTMREIYLRYYGSNIRDGHSQLIAMLKRYSILSRNTPIGDEYSVLNTKSVSPASELFNDILNYSKENQGIELFLELDSLIKKIYASKEVKNGNTQFCLPLIILDNRFVRPISSINPY
jgi:hypothetical protein